jgi:DNA-binding response OmpR family regulator
MATKHAEPNELSVQRQTNSSQRILVVDDDADIRQLNAKVLVASGYQVDTAEDGAVAWAALQRNSYDLLVTDNNMPHLSGVELLENLLLAHIGLPVILVSGNVPTEELNRHPWLQIEATLLKPYTIADLLGTVEAVLGAASATCEQKTIYECQTDDANRPASVFTNRG